MEQINLLEHTTYDVEQIKKNKEFYATLLGEIERTYKIHRKSEDNRGNVMSVQFAPAPAPRITNVFIKVDLKGVVELVFNGVKIYDKVKLNKLKAKYNHIVFSCDDLQVRIEGVTYDNYKKYLADIVMCIESVGYSLA